MNKNVCKFAAFVNKNDEYSGSMLDSFWQSTLYLLFFLTYISTKVLFQQIFSENKAAYLGVTCGFVKEQSSHDEVPNENHVKIFYQLIGIGIY